MQWISSISDDQSPEEWNLTELNSLLLSIIPLQPIVQQEDQNENEQKSSSKHMLKEAATKLYEAKEAEFPAIRADP